MEIIESNLNGVVVLQNKKFEDHRGVFVKTFHREIFEEAGLQSDFKESFFSFSRKNVIRGMHFQMPPHDHAKLVYVTHGEILDVAVDVRKNSPTFGEYFSVVLSGKNAKSIYLGKGFAHGFLTLSDQACVVYLTTTVHAPSHDFGIRWDSFGFDWDSVKEPILSYRDNSFIDLKAFEGV